MLSTLERNHYHQQGYLILKSFYQDQDRAVIDPILLQAQKINWGGSGRFPCTHPIERGFADIAHHERLVKYALHPQALALARTLLEDEVLFRCNILVDLGFQEATPWHRDEQGKPFLLFMHYLTGASIQNGCLRVIPGSHQREEVEDEFRQLAQQQGSRYSPLSESVRHPQEKSLEVTSQELIIRHSGIWHSTHVNQTPHYRLLFTWAFLPRHQRGEWQFPFPEALRDSTLFSKEERQILGWE
jgi:ectoine hydroxylase-related dioxygenase (phytanoyl-CoA dioxygenase family)